MTRALLLAAVLSLAACKDVKKQLELKKLKKLDFATLPLPKDSDGDYLLFEVSKSKLALNPALRDPITALGACSDLLTHCYEPPGTTLDACVEAAPACATNKPWEEFEDCCPSSCADRYAKARSQGLGELAAFEKTYFLEPDCFPGVKSALEGK